MGELIGALGNIDEFGSPTSPPHMNGQRALDDEAAAFVTYMERAAGKGL
jgi:hypothetical protein